MATARQATFARVVKKRPIRQANEVGSVVDHNMSRELLVNECKIELLQLML